jgi:hypothetical protein
VAVYPEQDGPTSIMMGDMQDVVPENELVFDDMLETPHRMVMVSTVDEIKVLEMKVAATRIRVRVWVNDLRWADKVVVGLG